MPRNYFFMKYFRIKNIRGNFILYLVVKIKFCGIMKGLLDRPEAILL